MPGGRLHGFLHAAAATTALPLNARSFVPAQGRRLWLFIDLTTGPTCTLRPIFQPDDPLLAAEDATQYPDATQDIALTAAGQFARQITVPRSCKVALQVQAIGGGSVRVVGVFEDEI